MRPARAVFFVLSLCTLLLCGCKESQKDVPAASKGGAPAAAPAASSGEPVSGGRIVMATIGEPSNLIPPLASDSASHEVADLLYVSLLRYDKDILLECMAAERYEVLEDGKLLRFWIKPGIRWTDGVELTAEDVEFTYKLMEDVRRQAAADPTPTPTDVLLVDARMLEVRTQGQTTLASAYFDTLLREDPKAEHPEQVREIWHFVRRDDIPGDMEGGR